jgi:hypothetical protein
MRGVIVKVPCSRCRMQEIRVAKPLRLELLTAERSQPLSIPIIVIPLDSGVVGRLQDKVYELRSEYNMAIRAVVFGWEAYYQFEHWATCDRLFTPDVVLQNVIGETRDPVNLYVDHLLAKDEIRVLGEARAHADYSLSFVVAEARKPKPPTPEPVSFWKRLGLS